MPVVSGKIKVSCIDKLVTNTTHHFGVIPIPEFGDQYPNGETSLTAKRPGKQARLVVHALGRCFDALSGSFGDRTARHIVEDNRNSGWIQTKMSRKLLQAHSPAGFRLR